METINVECDSCEPDSTVEAKETLLEPPGPPPQTPLQEMLQREAEIRRQWDEILKERDRETKQVRLELEERQKEHESTASDLRFNFKLRETGVRGCEIIQKPLEEAIALRSLLQKEIDIERMWRPPSLDMSQRKQMVLRERVYWMKSALTWDKIPMPDECDGDIQISSASAGTERHLWSRGWWT